VGAKIHIKSELANFSFKKLKILVRFTFNQ